MARVPVDNEKQTINKNNSLASKMDATLVLLSTVISKPKDYHTKIKLNERQRSYQFSFDKFIY